MGSWGSGVARSVAKPVARSVASEEIPCCGRCNPRNPRSGCEHPADVCASGFPGGRRIPLDRERACAASGGECPVNPWRYGSSGLHWGGQTASELQMTLQQRCQKRCSPGQTAEGAVAATRSLSRRPTPSGPPPACVCCTDAPQPRSAAACPRADRWRVQVNESDRACGEGARLACLEI